MKNYLRLMIVPLFSSPAGSVLEVHGMLPWRVKAEQVYAIVPELEKVIAELDAALEGMKAKGLDYGDTFMALWDGQREVQKQLDEAKKWIMHHEDDAELEDIRKQYEAEHEYLLR